MGVLFQPVDLPKFLKPSQVPVLWLSAKHLSPTLKLIELMDSSTKLLCIVKRNNEQCPTGDKKMNSVILVQ